MPYHQPAFDLLFNISPALVALVPVALIIFCFGLAYYYDEDVIRERERKRQAKK